jgi:L-alanine-DL-glutamate epimerase-like enolase superfamily enzyme
MKITRVAARPVSVHVPDPPYNSEGAGTKYVRSRLTPSRPTRIHDHVLVTVETDDGAVGVGEAQADIGFFGETQEEVLTAVQDYLGPQLVGKDPLDREYLFTLIDYRGNSCAKAGIDLALHDLIGKALGVPVGVLIGGPHKSRVAVSIEIAGGPPRAMAEACMSFVAMGVRAFKPKIGSDPDRDAERLRVIRDAVGPEVSIRADANQGYNTKEAIRLCRLAEKFDIRLELLEQPVAAWDLQGMAAVRRAVDIPIEADESCYTVQDAMQIVRHEAADVLNIKLSKAGGLYAAKKIAAVAEASGLRCVLGTAFGLGLEIAAKLHLAASTMGVVDAVEFTELGLHPNFLKPPHDSALSLPLRDGCLPVPDGPGLGVELDQAAIDRLVAPPVVAR